MPNVKISALPNVTSSSYTDSDLFVLVNYTLPSGTTSNTTLSALTEYIWSGYTGTTSGNCISSLCVSGPIKSDKDIEINQVKAGRGGGELASNTGFGKRMLENNTTGVENTAMGEDVLYSNTTGSRNSALGRYALKSNVSGSDNIAIGTNSLINNTSNDNVSIGNDSLSSNVIGSSNVSIGKDSLVLNDSDYNVSVGTLSMTTNTGGLNNTSLGFSSLVSNTVGSYNVSLGDLSLSSNSIGDGNVSIGSSAGASNVSGSNNVFIGYGSDCLSTNLTNATAIGWATLASQNNTVVLGNGADVGIGTSLPTSKLDVVGLTGYEQLRLRTSYTPSGTTDTNGDTGDVSWDDNYTYVKTSVGWKRSGLSTF